MDETQLQRRPEGAYETVGDKMRRYRASIPQRFGEPVADMLRSEQAALADAGVPAGAIRVGDRLPDAALVTMDGEATTLAAVAAARPAVLVFYRGDWCPFCDILLRTYQSDLLPALAARDTALIAVSPQAPVRLGAAAADKGVTFPLLSDPGNALARAAGITMTPGEPAQEIHRLLGIDIPAGNADGTREIPFPTVLVLDATRTVRFVDVHTDYTTRTEPADVLLAVDEVLLLG